MPSPPFVLEVEPTDSVACQTLADAFALIADQRKSQGRQYPLSSVLQLCLIAVLHGCRNPTQIFEFGRIRPGLLGRLGFRPPMRRRCNNPKPKEAIPCPNEDTITTLLHSIDPADFNDCLALWVTRMLPKTVHAACDGKALRGAEEHVLEIFINDVCFAVWQLPVGKKQNELSTLESAIADILAKYPQIKLLTGDAMFCQKSIAQAAVDARRHYFLQLKSPHKTDVAIAREAIAQYSQTPALDTTQELRGGLLDESS